MIKSINRGLFLLRIPILEAKKMSESINFLTAGVICNYFCKFGFSNIEQVTAPYDSDDQTWELTYSLQELQEPNQKYRNSQFFQLIQ